MKYYISELPLSKEVIIPESGLKEHTYYLVHISYKANNPVHQAILGVWCLVNGMPGAHSAIWSIRYSRPSSLAEVYFLEIERELFSEEDTSVELARLKRIMFPKP